MFYNVVSLLVTCICVPSGGSPCFSENNSTALLPESRPRFSSQPKYHLHSQIIITFPARVRAGISFTTHLCLLCLWSPVFSLLIYTKTLQAIAIWLTTCFGKCFIGTQPCPFIYILSVAAFVLQQQSWVFETETVSPKGYRAGLPAPGLYYKILTCSASRYFMSVLGPPALPHRPGPH